MARNKSPSAAASCECLTSRWGSIWARGRRGEGDRARFQTRPDRLIKRGGQTELVIDTKWKRIGFDPEDKKHGVAQADVYQMMVYGRLYDCPELLLLYPHHAGLGEGAFARNYTVTGCDDRLRLATLHMALGAAELEGRLMGALGLLVST